MSIDKNYIRHVNWTRIELDGLVYTNGTFSILDIKNNDNYVIAKALRSSNIDDKDRTSPLETNLKYHIISFGGILKGFSVIHVFNYGVRDSGVGTRYHEYTLS